MANDQHFFGSTCMNWATGKTRVEVLAKLARAVGADTIKNAMKQSDHGGLYVWTCRVKAPENATYEIDNFCPQGIEWDASEAFALVNVKGHVLPIESAK